MERALKAPWFLGEFSACDIYAAMLTRWRPSIGRDWEAAGHVPRLMELAEKLSRRERIAPVWQRHFVKRRSE